MMISEIQTRSPFKDLFTINSIVLKALEKDIRKIISNAIRDGIKIEHIEQIVKESLKAHHILKDTTGDLT